MSTKRDVLLAYQDAPANYDGLMDSELCFMLPDLLPATLRGTRVRLCREGYLQKIAEEPNTRGYACGVYDLTEKGRQWLLTSTQ